MSMRTAHARLRDANEPEIIKALRAAGAVVQPLNIKGAPDLLVGYRNQTFLVEVKNPEADRGAKKGGRRTKGRGALTPDQVDWFDAWTGDQVHVVINPAEALAAIEARPLEAEIATARKVGDMLAKAMYP